MKKFFFILLLACPALASGPKYNQKDPLLQDEFENVYKDLGNITSNGIRGSTSGANACAGCVGEYISATWSAVTAAASGAYSDATSIALTPGDWDIAVNNEWNTFAVANVTFVSLGISTTSGDSAAGQTQGVNRADFDSSAVLETSLAIPRFRVSITSNTTYYAKVFSLYSGTAPKSGGIISARRIR